MVSIKQPNFEILSLFTLETEFEESKAPPTIALFLTDHFRKEFSPL